MAYEPHDETLAADSDRTGSSDGSPVILGPTPSKRPHPASQSVRRLDLDFDRILFAPPTASRSLTGIGSHGARSRPTGSGSGSIAQQTSPTAATVSSSGSPPAGLSKQGASSDALERVLAELHQSNAQLRDMTNRLDIMDKRIKSMEEEGDADDEGDGHGCTRKTKAAARRKRKHCGPSKEIRRLVRRTYNVLKEQAEEDGQEEEFVWDTTVRFDNPRNQAVLKKVMQEVKGIDPAVSTVIIRDAAHTFFTSTASKTAQESSGKYCTKLSNQRKTNRKRRKLEARKATLMKLKTLDERSKQKWMTALTYEMMTSEDSEWVEADNEGNTQKVYTKRPLPWRSDKVSEFFQRLDASHKRGTSQRSKDMTLPRDEGIPSDRSKPISLSRFAWLFK